MKRLALRGVGRVGTGGFLALRGTCWRLPFCSVAIKARRIPAPLRGAIRFVGSFPGVLPPAILLSSLQDEPVCVTLERFRN